MKNITTFIIFTIICQFISFSQLMNYPSIPNATKVLFLEKNAQYEENYTIQLDLIQHYIKNQSFNGIVLEQSSSYQWVIDNIIENNDTSNLHLLFPITECSANNREYINTLTNNMIEITNFAREHHIPIYCLDIEYNLLKTKEIFFSILSKETSSSSDKKSVFENLKDANNLHAIEKELIALNNSKNKWKKQIPNHTFKQLDKILTNVHLQSTQYEFWNHRNEYLYHQMNQLLSENKALKPIVLSGYQNSFKNEYQTNSNSNNKFSVATLLNNDNKSVCKGEVAAIATNFIAKNENQTKIHNNKFFKENELNYLTSAIKNEKFHICKTEEIPFDTFLKEAYDYVITINDAKRLN